MPTRLFRREDRAAELADALYGALVVRARAPVFYTAFQVPDTIDGRFDLLALHAFLVLEPLGQAGDAGDRVGGLLATRIFTGFEEALRDLGVGDIGLSRRIKQMADAFYGRLTAYGAAGGEAAMTEALVRNLYRGAGSRALEAARLATYVVSVRAQWRGNAAPLLAGNVDFGPLPAN